MAPSGVFATIALWDEVATTMGFAVGAIAALIALAGFLRSSADAASAHMHGLFRDYLRIRMEGGRTLPAERILSFKLYTLEEMYAWVRREMLWAWTPSRRSDLKGWRSTIVSHLLEDRDNTLRSLRNATDAYGDRFLLLAARELEAPDLAEWVRNGRKPSRVGRFGDSPTARGMEGRMADRFREAPSAVVISAALGFLLGVLTRRIPPRSDD